MIKGNKELFKYLGIIFVSVLLTCKLPRDSYSIMQYVIGPIRFENSVVYLSGIIPLIIFVIGIRGLFRLERYASKSKLLIFLTVIILVVPIMRSSVEAVKTAYFWTINDGLKSIDLKDANFKILDVTDSEATLKIKLTLIDHGRDTTDFKVRLYLPGSLMNYFDTELIELDEQYKTFGHRNVFSIDKNITVNLADGCTAEEVQDSHWYWETFRYDLYNEKQSVKMIYHGI